MRADKLKGMAVVSIDDGAKVGRVDDVMFDTRPPHVLALRVDSGNQPLLIPFDQVRSIGSDAVTVQSASVAVSGRAVNAADAQPSLRDLSRLKVVDESGAFLGTPRDIEITPEDGRLSGLSVHRGGVLGIGGETHTLTAADICSIGDEVMVVREHEGSGASSE
jgi:sporulation protein YlmC with PRC-barrel domain